MRAEVIVLAQVDDLADDVGARGERAVMRAGGAIPEPVEASSSWRRFHV